MKTPQKLTYKLLWRFLVCTRQCSTPLPQQNGWIEVNGNNFLYISNVRANRLDIGERRVFLNPEIIVAIATGHPTALPPRICISGYNRISGAAPNAYTGVSYTKVCVRVCGLRSFIMLTLNTVDGILCLG